MVEGTESVTLKISEDIGLACSYLLELTDSDKIIY